jgi:hypothetical protein
LPELMCQGIFGANACDTHPFSMGEPSIAIKSQN